MLRRPKHDFPPFPPAGSLREWAWAVEHTEVLFLNAWEQECLLGWYLAPRSLPHSLAVFIHEGRSRWDVGKEKIEGQAGDLLLIPEGTQHAARLVSAQPFRATFVHFTARVFGVRCLLTLLGFPYQWQQWVGLSETMAELVRLSDHHPVGWRLRGQALLTDLLLRCLQESPHRFCPTTTPKEAKVLQRLCPAFQLVTSSNNKVSIKELAQVLACSPTHLRRLFQQVFHTPPRRWLLEQRLQRAAYLLETSEKTVQQVADECGFESLSHFVRYFRQRFGCSPSQYRKQFLGQPVEDLAQAVGEVLR